MKNKIKQNLNQETETTILDFDGGNGSSIPMLLEIAREHPEPLKITIIDRRSAAIAEQLLLDNGFEQEGKVFSKDNLRFNIISKPEYLMQAIYSSAPFDLSIALGDKISAIAPQTLRHDVIKAISDVSDRMALSFKSDDYHMEDLTFARSRGYERGEIVANGPDGLQTCGVYDERQVKNILTAYGAKEIEVFKQDQHPMLAIFTCIGSCFKSKMLGAVAKGKAARLDGRLITREI